MQKIFTFIAILCFFSSAAWSQSVPAHLNDTLFSTYYQQRVSHFKSLPAKKNAVIFLGNSITDGAEWNELFADNRLLNRGISGDVTAGVLNRLDEIIRHQPEKIFLLIGTNDLSKNISPDIVLKNIYLTAQIIQKQSSATQLYVQSILPINNTFDRFKNHYKNHNEINLVNQALQKNASVYNYQYLDIATPLMDNEKRLSRDFTNDGLHLNGKAYQVWKNTLYPYVFGFQPKPALIPYPQQVQWTDDYFIPDARTAIIISNDSIAPVAKSLQKTINNVGNHVTVSNRANASGKNIMLKIGKVNAPLNSREAYQLQINKNDITLIANTLQGLHHGVQTIRQLMRNTNTIATCSITDYPAFAWRGYMVDVGRNYQSMDLLKQQIDGMAKLKYNIFHFHLTEDVAWRIQIKKYPQLTDAVHMTRDKGKFYTIDEINELKTYCEERHILMLPEIDMPGHSKAFERAMDFNMQSDSGLLVMKEIMTEFCDTYDFPYIHIGADEVKITNDNFLPEMISLIEGKGRTVVGWEPGGNFTPSVIRQLWMENAAHLAKLGNVKKLDSRNLYINHMDAEESVVSIYNHQILNVDKGDNNNLGGILCLWNDRNLDKGEDNLTHNPVYSSLLAFAERAWIGGGIPHNYAVMLPQNKTAFIDFENRLLDLKKTDFNQLPFPYVKQSNIEWQLIGPYDNGGDLAKKFAPELKNFNTDKIKNKKTVYGGTIIPRHFWHPIVRGIFEDEKENTTYYGYQRYWSDADTTAEMWIGFYDFSRSTMTNTPDAGTWNHLQSKIWLNGNEIAPPKWQRAGQKGDLEIPYIDENYIMRKPTTVQLKKGWNEILTKIPIGSFAAKVWHTPNKWMFTAMIIEKQPGSINYQQGGGYRKK